MRLKSWAGQLTIAPGWALFVGQTGDNARHSHQAVQICLAARTPLSVAIGNHERIRAAAVAIGPRVSHAIRSEGGDAALLYLDPNWNDGRLIAERIGSRGFQTVGTDRLGGLPQEVSECSVAEWKEDESRAIRDRILGLWLAGGDSLPAVDLRVETVVRFIRGTLTQRRISASELAREVGISQSRLSHLFRQHTGVAIRPFILWTRLQRAIETVGEGESLTEAAHAAGFSDSAHLARTFRRMFGTTLSAGVGRLRIQLLNV